MAERFITERECERLMQAPSDLIEGMRKDIKEVRDDVQDVRKWQIEKDAVDVEREKVSHKRHNHIQLLLALLTVLLAISQLNVQWGNIRAIMGHFSTPSRLFSNSQTVYTAHIAAPAAQSMDKTIPH